jgi:O-antigen ligase
MKIICVTCGVLGILGVAVLHDPLFRTRLEASIETRDTAHREDIWRDSLTLSTHSPIFGFGNRSYMNDLGGFRGEGTRGTHNLPLSVLLATGVTGSLAFLFFYLTSAHAAWRHRKYGMGTLVFPWFVIAFVGSLSLNLESTKWYWLITALALAVPKSCAQAPGSARGCSPSGEVFADT